MRHDNLVDRGRLRHWQIDDMLPGVKHNTEGAYAWDDVVVSSSAFRLPTSAAPAEVTWKTSLKLLEFAASGGEYVHFTVQFPHGIVPAGPARFHVHFTNHDRTFTSGSDCRWQLVCTTANILGTYPTTQTQTVTYTSTATMPQDSHLLTASGDTLSLFTGYEINRSAVLIGRLQRLSSSTYKGDVGLLSADFHCKFKSMGTGTEIGTT